MTRRAPPAEVRDASEAASSLPGSGSVRIERLRFDDDGRISSPALFAECRAIRERVFVDEQSVPASLEWDGLDEGAEHFAACIDDARSESEPHVVGTARLRSLPDAAKAERVAVLPVARKHGVGRRLMETIEQRAREQGHSKLVLNAQVVVVPFYEGLGYTTEGEVFLSAGIEHLAMTKRIR